MNTSVYFVQQILKNVNFEMSFLCQIVSFYQNCYVLVFVGIKPKLYVAVLEPRGEICAISLGNWEQNLANDVGFKPFITGCYIIYS